MASALEYASLMMGRRRRSPPRPGGGSAATARRRPLVPYNDVVHSVADGLRADGHRRLASMTPDERLALAFQLADEDIALLRAAEPQTVAEARARIGRSRHVGRVPSRAACP
jgi:hypothetical protein